MFAACSGDSSLLGSSVRALASDSPVTVDRLTRSPEISVRRQSAGTKSPSSSSTMSPGTSSLASRPVISPARSALTFCGSNWRRAATARSALYSCQNEKTPLMTMTPTMASPSFAIPCPGSKCSATNDRPAPIQRTMAKKWVNS
ncbi:MAG: hypothetical protein AW07_02985 [Candidatus Accumulibacter sp. SK-11]|nr:MAG: hypothetical protein AW07_02985 [Candidatus Accumulibacter sp. SK-11]